MWILSAKNFVTLGLARYWRNQVITPGTHRRLDLCPGFELDEFCSWFIALDGCEGNQ